ncbi:MAG TPA: GNAT family N-acetyltransferase [Miltoncostaeaceae bacterium]|nr:GNAT family N-acetyltransferase [Miltoncostaeaceae bacterium]
MSDEIRIETPRLLLRPPLIGDFEGWADLMGDERSARFIGGVQPRPVAWRGFLALAGAWRLQGFGMFSVIERSSGRWIGRVGPWQPVGWPGTEVGWGLRVDAWGHGYAGEAAVAAIDWAFAHLGWDEVVHCIAPENRPSVRLAERLGSRLIGPGHLPAPLDGQRVDIWGQTREEWYSRPRGMER